MKPFIIGLMFVMACGIAHAEALSIGDTLKQVPGASQGIAFSLVDNKVNYLTTIDIVKWKGLALEAGIAADAENTGTKAVAVISYDVINAKKLGVTIPVLDMIDVRLGAYYGAGRIEVGSIDTMKGNNEQDFGFSATVLKLKF